MTLLPGGHVCGVGETPERRAVLAAAWVRSGLEAGERVLWIDAPGGPILDWLGAHGIAWRQPLAEGRLLIGEADDLLRLRSAADIPGALARVTELADQARADGYRALRMGAEAGVALQRMPDVAAQFRFEAAWEQLTRDRPISFLCVYDPHTYGSDVAGAVSHHPRGLADGMMFAVLEAERFRIAGEIDRSNVEEFGQFADAATRGRDVLLDLGGLQFIDACGTARLVELSRALAPSRLRVAAAPPQLRKIIDLSDWSGELDLV